MDKYRFDFTRNFFSSLEAEKAELAYYDEAMRELENLKGEINSSAACLLRALQIYDRVLVEFQRHYTYHYLRVAVDTRNAASKAEYSRLEEEFTKRTLFLRAELMQTSPTDLDRFLGQLPELGVYRFAIESAQRYRPYTLSLEIEKLIGSLLPLTTYWEYDLYDTLLKRTDFGNVRTPDGVLDVFRQRATIASHPDGSVRRAGFKKLYAGYWSQRDLYALALINLVKARNRLAQLHHFEDAPSEVYFASDWSKHQVTELLEQIRQRSEIYRCYQRLRRAHTQKKLGLKHARLWDITARGPGEPFLHLTIERAIDTIREATAALGSEYSNELASLLDPANGRMDILPGSHRKPGGFSKGFPGIPTVFYSSSFEGQYNDVRVLMHESTHAVHRQLMNNHHVLPVYAEGPHFLFESFAIFNELLLADYLYKHETDTGLKQYYLEQFFDGKGMALFFIAQDAALEQAIYEEVEQGRVVSADDLDQLTKRVFREFDIWTDKHDELKMRWITNRLFYEDPLYNINYVYGSLLALKYYQVYQKAPEAFAASYIAYLSNGFIAPPDVLLDQYFSINLRDPHLIHEVVQFLGDRVGLLEQEYTGR